MLNTMKKIPVLKLTFCRRLLPIFLLTLFLTVPCLLMLTGCSKQFSKQVHLGVICTSSVKPESELIFLNQAGKHLRTLKFGAQGVFNIEQSQNQLVLPVTYSDEIIYIDLPKDVVERKKTLEYPLFYSNLGKAEFIIYNSDVEGDIDYLTYVLKGPDYEKRLRIKGFPLATAVENNKAYIYLDIKGEADVIVVLDLQAYRVEREIPVKKDLLGISTLLYLDDKLLIPHSSTAELVIIPLANPAEMTTVPLAFTAPHLIFTENDHLIILHYNGGITVLDRKTYEVLNKAQLPYTILRGQLANGQVYLLVKEEQQRKMVVVDPENLQITQTIEIKCKEDLLPQNFTVFSQ